MKYIISNNQKKLILENNLTLDDEYKIVKKFIEKSPPKLPDWVYGLEVEKPKFGKQVMVIAKLEGKVFSSQVEKLLDGLWERIYTYTGIPVAVDTQSNN